MREPVPPRRSPLFRLGSGRLWLGSTVIWSGFVAFQVAVLWLYFRNNEPATPSLVGLTVVSLGAAIPWILGTPFIAVVTERQRDWGWAHPGGWLLQAALAFAIHALSSAGDFATRVYYGLESFPGVARFHWAGLLTRFLPFDGLRYLLVVALAFAALALALLRRKEREADRLRGDLLQARMHVLRMQLNPHFIFNSLHAISELVYIDPRLADRSLTRLAGLLRRALDRAECHEVTLGEELDFTREYLEIQQMRLGDGLRIAIEVPAALHHAAVPTLLLQPLVENAVRHGVRRAGGGRVRVSASAEDGTLSCVVEDDGPGWPDTLPREGLGLATTRHRLSGLYDGAAGLALESREGGGARVRVWLPLHDPSSLPGPEGAR